tara:strand:+ start:68016 stop:68192 length:177 start_codon:yes stop_codon:yes gene_type:complete
MDGMFVLLVVLVAGSIILRAMANAARNSAKEELVRRVVKEHIRQRKLDELYGRNQRDD